jgi:hypothetical protein
MDSDVALLADDELVDQLTKWAGRVAAGEAHLLRLLGELDAREAWAQPGVLSCAHWASWKLGLTLGTARERVRVARCLRELPRISAALSAGRVSYAQVRALTRVATAEEEEHWLELARFTTAAQLERAVRGVGRARAARGPRDAEAEAAAAEAAAAVRVSWDVDGSLLLNLRIAPARAPGVLASLESAQQAEQRDRDAQYAQLAKDLAAADPAGHVSAEAPQVDAQPSERGSAERPDPPSDVSAEAPDAPQAPPPYAEPYEYLEPVYPLPVSRPDPLAPRTPAEVAALAEWRAECDRRRARRDAARAWQDHVQRTAGAAGLPARRATLADAMALTRPESLPPVTLKLLVDPASGWARTSAGELLPPTTLGQVLRTLPGRQPTLRARPLTAADLRLRDLGRRSRVVSPALRVLLGQLDGERCRFPSCTRTRNLHAHHVRYWSQGGRTDLANLVLVCARHHTLIHARGFQLVLSPDRTLTVRTADDIPVPHHPARPETTLAGLDGDAFTSEWQNDPFDLGYVVMVMAQHTR